MGSTDEEDSAPESCWPPNRAVHAKIMLVEYGGCDTVPSWLTLSQPSRMMSVNNYFRAVRLSLKYRWNIVGILVSSFMVAVLWGANIGSVYPFMRVVLDGGSISGMLSTQADYIEISQLVPTSLDQKDSWLAAGGTRLAKRLRQLASVSPSEPFPSLIWVVVFLFSGTLIKCLFLAVSMILVERLAQLATLDLRNQFFRHTMKMELSAFGDGRTSDLMSRFTNDIGAVKDGITVLFGKSIREPLKMAVCLTAAALDRKTSCRERV